MKEVVVKLPIGLESGVSEVDMSNLSQKPRKDSDCYQAADDEKHLLMKKCEGSPKIVVDSSGCSSAHGSLPCSIDAASNISEEGSTDSGMGQQKTQSAEDLSDIAVTSLRQRNTRQSSIGKLNVAFPLEGGNTDDPKNSSKNYCVLGIDSSLNPEEISTYIPLPPILDKCQLDSSSTPYVLSGEPVKTAIPSYIPFKTPILPDKNPAYVTAGSKDALTDTEMESKPILPQDNTYIKIADNMTLKNSAELKSWQPSQSENSTKTGYVTFGEVASMKMESKGYVPHRHFETKTYKED